MRFAIVSLYESVLYMNQTNKYVLKRFDNVPTAKNDFL